ncbi:carbamoyl-phosphate synthase, large subunit [Methanococcus aeolicus Nankai-3]|uniref:Carbamoyl phosphate synthase large chain n=1 Tax=Methanococcus aeolicus (strain ATCC BAA-1280 / DSM 17508 / OCM 812 / Nankai-3) TaxID=419665 RepID=A6UU81_META3|nr:carbamoyl-phosphate synthase large subunit [Methanococcus aeolicus]ABR56053.1 carbamoyl-phosphate synthase, large subunit [Methanococcus aeolicus Nankai-3]
MPKREDIKKIMIIGAGPIIVGQACEFDYSGSQACKALKELGYEIVLVNSNPATIMTDPEMADEIYIEPLVPEVVEKIIEKEQPDAILPTLGGQTALNLAVELADKGILDKYGVELIGAKLDAIRKAEDRELFKEACKKVGVDVLKSEVAYTVEESLSIAEKLGYPVVVRPAFTLGGTGGGVAFNPEELKSIASKGLEYSLKNQILIEESIIGWKEYEYEVIRDLNDNVIIVCTIENIDPMGIHTGDSITVAPTQTLSDEEYQLLRDYSIKIIREIGVETGGSNIQFAVNPENGRIVAIEMNPRVSRSSALASKATGYPIAKVAAKLAVGLTLDEIKNEITGTSAAFEPTIDYVVVKIPRWDFDKFSGVDNTLTTQMKSVGEVMAMGRTFEESFLKALRSLDHYNIQYQFDGKRLNYTNPKGGLNRIYDLFEILKIKEIDEVYKITKIDPWFLNKIKNIMELRSSIKSNTNLDYETLLKLKKYGISDKIIADISGKSEKEIRNLRKKYNIIPKYKMVDTCGAEFEAKTPYYYSTYNDEEDEIKEIKEIKDIGSANSKKKIIVLGSGPNRIGQGIEFDYCCVHTIKSLKEEGFETIMVNCNPETVSTDFDLADKLYFEPLYPEDVLNIIEKENPYGVVIQVGGQTPLNLSKYISDNMIVGTPKESIDLVEDREKFSNILNELKILQPPNGIVFDEKTAVEVAEKIGYPVLVRPSYVIGGRAMHIVYNNEELKKYMKEAVMVSPELPILIDKFLEDAIEVDVDAICDGEDVFIGGIMEHIEEAGIHSGDSACVIPTQTLSNETLNIIKDYTKKLSLKLKIKGLINIQYAIKDNTVYVLEANPRASRTIPYLSKAIGISLAKIAAKIMVGRKLKDLNVVEKIPDKVCVKEAVFSYGKWPNAEISLCPEMKSTGEVMGIDKDFGLAYYKAQLAAGMELPMNGTVFISVNDDDKNKIIPIARKFENLGFKIVATEGTHNILTNNGIAVEKVFKISEGRPNIIDLIKSRKIDLIINTPKGSASKEDEYLIKRTAIDYKIPYITTTNGAKATYNAIENMGNMDIEVYSI